MSAERLVRRLRAEGFPVPDGWSLHRTRAGHLQRACGAWSWFILDADSGEVIGSQWSVGTLLRAPRWSIHQGQFENVPSVDPTDAQNPTP